MCLCAHHSEITRLSEPTQQRLAKDSGMSLTSVRRTLDKLVEMGEIEIVGSVAFQKKKGKSYKILKYRGDKMAERKEELSETLFNRFYTELYPKGRRVKRPDALKAWKKIEKSEDIQKVYQKIKQDLFLRQLKGTWRDHIENKTLQFINHPSVYLNNRMWEDDLIEGEVFKREQVIQGSADDTLKNIL